MILVNLVYDDEELLEPYEWQDDDRLIELSYIHYYHVTTNDLHDFLYGKLLFKDIKEDTFVVGDDYYCFVVKVKDYCLWARGSLLYHDRDYFLKRIRLLNTTCFDYKMIEEAYDKEFGLTREERMKKICLEEVIDEIFVAHVDLFNDICEQLNIKEEGPSERYLALKQKIERGYSSLHELLYKELVQKR